MAIFCRQHTKPIANERAFCQALLNNENFAWEDNDLFKRRKKGFYLPPDDFVYGLKHPKQTSMTGIAAVLQHDNIPINRSKPKMIPDFISINKIAIRLGLTKVRDLHQYRKTMNNYPNKLNFCYCPMTKKKFIPDIIHGRVTDAQPSIRDLIENKYLHEWMHKSALRRCKEIFNDNNKTCKKKE